MREHALPVSAAAFGLPVFLRKNANDEGTLFIAVVKSRRRDDLEDIVTLSRLWGIPGGIIKTGQSSYAAARRKITEETGIKVNEPTEQSDGFVLTHKILSTDGKRHKVAYLVNPKGISEEDVPKIQLPASGKIQEGNWYEYGYFMSHYTDGIKLFHLATLLVCIKYFKEELSNANLTRYASIAENILQEKGKLLQDAGYGSLIRDITWHHEILSAVA